MSEAIDPKQPVTIGQLGEILKNISTTFNDALQKRDQQNEARFNQFAQVLQQVVDKVNQAPAEKGGALATIDKGEVINKLADRVMAKVFHDEDDPSADVDFQQYKKNIHTLYNLGIKRAIQATDVIIKKELKVPTASNNIAKSMIESDLTHGPI